MLSTINLKNSLLLVITLAGIIAMFVIKPIMQDPSYHLFADTRELHSIPNFWNVISNLPFLVIGFAGMFFILKKWENYKLNINVLVFFAGIFFTAAGSMYYHLSPNNATLLWDRLPMTIAFMGFFSIIVGEFICLHTGKKILLPLILLGILSIIYWQMTENRGHGDLRFYALVQYLPILLIPVILLLYKSNSNSSFLYWFILILYVIAKLFEASDHFVFKSLQIISGHSIKHVIAAIAPLVFLMALYKNKTLRNE